MPANSYINEEFTIDGVTYTVQSQKEGTRSYVCTFPNSTETLIFSSRAINKALARTTTKTDPAPAPEFAAPESGLTVESVVAQSLHLISLLDAVEGVQAAQQIAVAILNEKPMNGVAKGVHAVDYLSAPPA